MSITGMGRTITSNEMINGFSVGMLIFYCLFFFVAQPYVSVYAKPFANRQNEIWARRAAVEDVSTAVAALRIKATFIL